ncbi:alpha/beta hydrolase [Pararhodobacter sp.]|uniref:alpha/beta hydrolase n=1 Tax=Pararhodobacter sp. TaxID=2127056 RepID=UPI002B003969|nr:alpha/beta-hydrolase family protein [Pararhodobacter sp.]
MRYLRAPGLAVLPLLLGLLFFATSLTPSLIPRDWLVQGVLGGVVMALGYGVGKAIGAVWWLMALPPLKGRIATIVHLVFAVPVAVVVVLCLMQTQDWQNGIRTRMGLAPVTDVHTLRMIAMTIVVFTLMMLLAYALRYLFDRVRHWLYRYMPQRTADVAGFVLTAFVLLIVTRDGVLDYVITALDRSYTLGQALFDDAPPPPTRALQSGSTASLVDWGAMGQPGRDYVLRGPDAADITAFSGRPALDPLRVYVGLAQSETPEARAAVALAELQRVGGFERSVLIIALPTGTGWLDPGSVDTVEYMHGGDIATVAVQYSYLQSPLALILETRAGLDQARELIRTVHGYWRSLPHETRPKLYIHGLSLGAWSSMYGTDLFALLDDPIDGAFWTGPPFPSATWQAITAERAPDSPYVAPIIGNGQLVRFASHTRDAGGPDGWGTSMRLMFLQYSSDPIVFYEPASLFRAPAWMSEPPASDVSPELRFMPIVTQFQLAMDMALANTAPPGHGHAYYGPDYIGPWVAVTDPPNWSAADTARLIAHCDTGFQNGCAAE